MAPSNYSVKKDLEITSATGSPTLSTFPVYIKVVDGTESTTGTGNIVIDWTNVSDQTDILVTDDTDTTVDYYFDEFDAANNVARIWIRPSSIVRDGTEQLRIHYDGDGSATDDSVTESTLWDNVTGIMGRWSLDETSGAYVDSTSNNIDSDVETLTSRTASNAMGGGNAIDTDGVDDQIVWNDQAELEAADRTLFCFVNPQENPTSGGNRWIWTKIDSNFNGFGIGHDSTSDTLIFLARDSNSDGALFTATYSPLFDGNYHMVGLRADSSNNDTRAWIDDTEQASSTATFNRIADVTNEMNIGEEDVDANGGLDMLADEFHMYSDVKSTDWRDATWEQSAAGGQTLVSQQAAETKAQVVSAQTTELTVSNPEPAVSGTGTATVTAQETSLTVNNPAPTVTGTGTATLSAQETSLTVTNPEPAVNATGTATLQAQTTELTVSNPNPNIFRAGVIDAPVTNLTVNNPEPTVSGTGTVSVSAETTQLTVSNPEPNITSPQNIAAPTTSLTYQTPAPAVNATGTATLQAQTTELTLTTPVPRITISDILVNAPTKALITTPNKFALMEQKTFKVGDTGDSLTATLKDEDGVIDLQGVGDVKLVMEGLNTSTTLDASVTITDAPNGEIEYSWSSSGDPIDTEDVYRSEFKIETNGDVETVPNDGYISIKVSDDV